MPSLFTTVILLSVLAPAQPDNLSENSYHYKSIQECPALQTLRKTQLLLKKYTVYPTDTGGKKLLIFPEVGARGEQGHIST